MSLRCEYCGKVPQYGNKVSHAHNKTSRRWLPNLQSVTIRAKNGNRKKVRVCAQCIRSGKTLAAS